MKSGKQKRHWYALCLSLLLAGCAQVQATSNPGGQRTGGGDFGFKERLAQASEQASRAQLQVSEMMAHEIGSGTANEAGQQDLSNLPDYLQQQVRMNFYGPVDEVLTRLANDLDYRFETWGKAPMSSGSALVQVSGSKPVSQHITEIGAQIAWPIVVDSRNRRLLLDYRKNTGSDEQVRMTRRSMENNRERTRGSAVEVKGDPRFHEPRATATRLEDQRPPRPDSGNAMENSGWGVEIGAYTDSGTANQMLDWLEDRGMDSASWSEDGKTHIRLLASSQRVARSLRDDLHRFNIRGQVTYIPPTLEKPVQQSTPDLNHSMLASQAAPASRGSWRDGLVAPRTSMEPEESMLTDDERRHRIRTERRNRSMPDLRARPSGWGVQAASFNRESQAIDLAEDLRNKGYPAFVFQSGQLYGVRVGQFDRREQAQNLRVPIQQMGFNDAFVVQAR